MWPIFVLIWAIHRLIGYYFPDYEKEICSLLVGHQNSGRPLIAGKENTALALYYNAICQVENAQCMLRDEIYDPFIYPGPSMFPRLVNRPTSLALYEAPLSATPWVLVLLSLLIIFQFLVILILFLLKLQISKRNLQTISTPTTRSLVSRPRSYGVHHLEVLGTVFFPDMQWHILGTQYRDIISPRSVQVIYNPDHALSQFDGTEYGSLIVTPHSNDSLQFYTTARVFCQYLQILKDLITSMQTLRKPELLSQVYKPCTRLDITEFKVSNRHLGLLKDVIYALRYTSSKDIQVYCKPGLLPQVCTLLTSETSEFNISFRHLELLKDIINALGYTSSTCVQNCLKPQVFSSRIQIRKTKSLVQTASLEIYRHGDHRVFRLNAMVKLLLQNMQRATFGITARSCTASRSLQITSIPRPSPIGKTGSLMAIPRLQGHRASHDGCFQFNNIVKSNFQKLQRRMFVPVTPRCCLLSWNCFQPTSKLELRSEKTLKTRPNSLLNNTSDNTPSYAKSKRQEPSKKTNEAIEKEMEKFFRKENKITTFEMWEILNQLSHRSRTFDKRAADVCHRDVAVETPNCYIFSWSIQIISKTEVIISFHQRIIQNVKKFFNDIIGRTNAANNAENGDNLVISEHHDKEDIDVKDPKITDEQGQEDYVEECSLVNDSKITDEQNQEDDDDEIVVEENTQENKASIVDEEHSEVGDPKINDESKQENVDDDSEVTVEETAAADQNRANIDELQSVEKRSEVNDSTIYDEGKTENVDDDSEVIVEETAAQENSANSDDLQSVEESSEVNESKINDERNPDNAQNDPELTVEETVAQESRANVDDVQSVEECSELNKSKINDERKTENVDDYSEVTINDVMVEETAHENKPDMNVLEVDEENNVAVDNGKICEEINSDVIVEEIAAGVGETSANVKPTAEENHKNPNDEIQNADKINDGEKITKHLPRIDVEELEFEVIDEEIGNQINNNINDREKIQEDLSHVNDEEHQLENIEEEVEKESEVKIIDGKTVEEHEAQTVYEKHSEKSVTKPTNEQTKKDKKSTKRRWKIKKRLIFLKNRMLRFFTRRKSEIKDHVDFANHVFPRWGGGIKDKQLGKLKFVNTCPIDNWLVILHYVSIQNPKVKKQLHKIPLLRKLEDLYVQNKFDMQKFKLMEANSIQAKKGCVDYFANEWNSFIRHMSPYFKNSQVSICSSPYCPFPKRVTHYTDGVAWADKTSSLQQEVFKWFNEEFTSVCGCKFDYQPPKDAAFSCIQSTKKQGESNPEKLFNYYCEGIRTTHPREFPDDMPLMIPVDAELLSQFGARVEMKDLPEEMIISGHRYELMAVTLRNASIEHYTCLFKYNNDWLYYDGLNQGLPTTLNTFPETCTASTILYVKSSF